MRRVRGGNGKQRPSSDGSRKERKKKATSSPSSSGVSTEYLIIINMIINVDMMNTLIHVGVAVHKV